MSVPIEWQNKVRQGWLEPVKWMEEEEERMPNQDLCYRPKGRRDPHRQRRRWNSEKPEQATGLILELQNKKKKYTFPLPMTRMSYKRNLDC
jgi:hypothetical protein